MSISNHVIPEKLILRFYERLAREQRLLCAYQGNPSAVQTEAGQQELIRLSHGLAGAGGTFGFPEISAAAMVLEDCLRQACSTQQLTAALNELILTITRARNKA